MNFRGSNSRQAYIRRLCARPQLGSTLRRISEHRSTQRGSHVSGIGPKSDSTIRTFLWPGKRKLYKPLPVEHLRHLFENLDAAVVILDKVVVGGKDGCDTMLDWQADG